MADAFSPPWLSVCLLLQLACQTKTESAKMEMYLPIPIFSPGFLIGKRSFQDGAMHMDKLSLFSVHCQTFRRPTILQLNIESLTPSKMNVLNHLAVQHETLVILPQETNCTSSEKLIFPSFALDGFSLSKGARPCHACP